MVLELGVIACLVTYLDGGGGGKAEVEVFVVFFFWELIERLRLHAANISLA